MCTCVQVLSEARKGDRIPEAGATGVCERHRVWHCETNAFTLRKLLQSPTGCGDSHLSSQHFSAQRLRQEDHELEARLCYIQV